MNTFSVPLNFTQKLFSLLLLFTELCTPSLVMLLKAMGSWDTVYKYLLLFLRQDYSFPLCWFQAWHFLSPIKCEQKWHESLTSRCSFFFSPFIFISWRLITLQYCSGFCHTLTWVSHGFTCISHPDPPSCLPLHPIPLCLPSAPAVSTCLIHPTWADDLFHPW